VSGEWPDKGLVSPKTSEKSPFQTRDEIRRTIARGGLSDDQKAQLWGSLYLTADELAAFLRYVSEAARHPFIYPMVDVFPLQNLLPGHRDEHEAQRPTSRIYSCRVEE
jgi:hypothetical protein